jgi:hypothetical protein
MTNLQVLHLSGTGLIGNLPILPHNNLILKDLSLSNNLFTGEIPKSIQNRDWINLDLAFNKLGGSLFSDFGDCTSLYLNNNYLSGLISQSLLSIKSIDILSGNVFSCKIINPETLPLYDHNASKYNCGSNSYNITVLVVFIFLFLFTVFKSKMWKLVNLKGGKHYYKKKCIFFMQTSFLIQPFFNKDYFSLRSAGNRYVKDIENDSFINEIKDLNINLELMIIEPSKNSSNTSNILLFCSFSDKMCQYFIWLIFSLLLFWTPLSFLLSSNYSLYEFNYSFSSSFINLTGLHPSLILLFFLTINLILLNYILVKKFPIQKSIVKYLSFENVFNNNKYAYFRVFSLAFVFIFNLVAMILLNIIYVYSTLVLGTIELFFVEILVSMLKIAWKWIVIPKLIQKTKILFIPKSIIADEEEIIFQCR